ncbi:hypothetical protein [Deinococcus ruber]|uniref:Uncharacterized protein n=1 Tax=Deinococcus ruber TaxID=1848197 RepID=A0A918BZ62_9DEIO|nr:hypothetical protein [Deinococcus ruber]GGQ97727.1 hypothetical protein GCM10008957_07780 [Deinococcus ruber]
MRSRFLLASLLALSCTAGATSLDFGASYATLGGALLRVGVTDYALAGFTLGAGISSRGVDASVSRAFVLTGLGAARARLTGAVLYGGGLSGNLDLSGTVGPVALTFGASAWNVAPDSFDPLARWAQTAPDLRPSGTAFSLGARYRLSRDVVLNAGGTLGAQNTAFVLAEFRQTDLTYRVGLRAGESVLGVSAGVGYTDPDSGLTAALDVLAGPSTLGLSGSVGLDGVLGDGSSLLAYAAYEPWRLQSQTVRVGVQASVQAGPGTLSVDGRGGWSNAAGTGVGVRVGYTLPLDAPSDDTDTAPATP